jgi:lipid A 3-O-deacylase
VPHQPKPFEAYVSAGAEGRLVGHNIFLDGNVLVDGPEIRIDRKDFVYDLKAGLTVRYKAIRFDYTWVQRSEEFDFRLRRKTEAEFGSATIGWS